MKLNIINIHNGNSFFYFIFSSIEPTYPDMSNIPINQIAQSIVLLFLIICNTSYGQTVKKQTDTLTVTFNAFTGEVSRISPYSIKQDGYIKFIIKDINLLRYSVELIEAQNNIVNSASLSQGNTSINFDPAIFNLNKSNTVRIKTSHVDTSSSITKLNSLRDSINTYEKSRDRLNNNINKTQDSLFKINEFLKKYDDLKKERFSINTRISLINSSDDKEKEKEKKIDPLKDDLFQINARIGALDSIEVYADVSNKANGISRRLQMLTDQFNIFNDSIDIFQKRFERLEDSDDSVNAQTEKFNDATKTYIAAIRDLDRTYDFYLRLINILYSDQPFKEIENEKKSLLQEVFNNPNLSRSDLFDYLLDKLKTVSSSFDEITKYYSSNLDSNSIQYFERLSVFDEQINFAAYQSFFLQVLKVFDALNETNFKLEYHTLIFSDNADLVRYSLKCLPHQNLPTSIETKPINFKYDVRIIGGVKIDVSSGLFWNYGIRDHSYRFDVIDNDSSLVVRNKTEDFFVPSVGLLFNIYKRSLKDLKFGGNIGFSTNTEKLNYYLGLSLLFGRSERINVNIGIAGAQVNRASGKYRNGTRLNIPIGDLPNEVPLISPFKIGGYFGISFNFQGAKNRESFNQISAM